MKTDGSVPVYDNYGPVQFPTADDDVAGAADFVATDVPTRIDRWRSDNPDFFDHWTTKYGCVIQFWGMRVYYGRCRDCSELVTKRRDISRPHQNKYKSGPTQLGRWPILCDRCRSAKEEAKADNARRRMARLRRQRYAFRDEQYARRGLMPVRQGVGGDEARIRAIQRAEDGL